MDSIATDKSSKVVEKRKRKRKADEGNNDKVINGKQAARTPTESKKINEYFVKHSGSSPVRHGTTPSSPAHQPPHPLVSAFRMCIILIFSNLTLFLCKMMKFSFSLLLLLKWLDQKQSQKISVYLSG